MYKMPTLAIHIRMPFVFKGQRYISPGIAGALEVLTV